MSWLAAITAQFSSDSSVLAEQKVNVVDMMNKSRGELAYNVIDVEGAPDPAVTAAIQAVAHVIRVRVI